MESLTSLITHPISLCVYVLRLAFEFVAKRKEKRFFYLWTFLLVVALVGGLFLAWQQTNKSPSSSTPPTLENKKVESPSIADNTKATVEPTTNQTSSGNQSPNISGTKGDVTVIFENPATSTVETRK